jgi:hypothetical protein
MPAAPRPARFRFPSSRLVQRSPQDELNLTVQAAQVIVCPALNGVEHLAIGTKQEWLAIGQRLTSRFY